VGVGQTSRRSTARTDRSPDGARPARRREDVGWWAAAGALLLRLPSLLWTLPCAPAVPKTGGTSRTAWCCPEFARSLQRGVSVAAVTHQEVLGHGHKPAMWWGRAGEPCLSSLGAVSSRAMSSKIWLGILLGTMCCLSSSAAPECAGPYWELQQT